MSTNLKQRVSGVIGGGGLLALLTLATSGLFKIAAFAREAFITSHFGLSNFTDAYFAFQQFPLIVMTFMFGAFSLAFTPAYAKQKRAEGAVPWLGGLLLYGTAAGLALTLLTILFTPLLLPAFTSQPSPQGAATVMILGATLVPIIWLGIWAGTTIANGQNLQAMFVAGLPYLLMTLLLLVFYWTGTLNDLSLPLSFLAGFGVMGAYALYSLVARGLLAAKGRSVAITWRSAGFRQFLVHLGASSIENLGFSANQLLLIFFIAKGGTGAALCLNLRTSFRDKRVPSLQPQMVGAREV